MDLLVCADRRAGRVRLNRPEALNAVTPAMIESLRASLEEWRYDPTINIVILEGEGPKAFCAGGDLRLFHEAGQRGDFAFGRDFWVTEYRLNAALAAYPKPIVSFIQGFVMGGGVGLACHVSHRIIDPQAQLAMPECGIGLVPDVGGSLLLARAPGHIGEYLALTGARINGAEAQAAGFADYLIPEDRWPVLVEDLARNADPEILAAAADPADSWEAARRQTIDEVFGLPDILAIAEAVKSSEFCEGFARGSPLSLAATLKIIRAARSLEHLEDALRQELCFTARASEQADFLEGIRAVIIDRDRRPNWRYPQLEDIPQGYVEALLTSVPEAEQLFPDPTGMQD